MRMWMVDPKCLCNQHLLGEHVECHMLVGSLRAGMTVQVQGLVVKGLVDPQRVRVRHDALAEEMTSRGMNHKSPLPEMPPTSMKGEIDEEENILDLGSRCFECGMRLKEAGLLCA
jgi:hypothetical protein